MGSFFNALKDGLRAATSGGSHMFKVSGTTVICPHCKNKTFEKGNAQLNTSGMSFIGLDWANKSAVTLICRNCGNVQWFLNDVEEI